MAEERLVETSPSVLENLPGHGEVSSGLEVYLGPVSQVIIPEDAKILKNLRRQVGNIPLGEIGVVRFWEIGAEGTPTLREARFGQRQNYGRFDSELRKWQQAERELDNPGLKPHEISSWRGQAVKARKQCLKAIGFLGVDFPKDDQSAQALIAGPLPEPEEGLKARILEEQRQGIPPRSSSPSKVGKIASNVIRGLSGAGLVFSSVPVTEIIPPTPAIVESIISQPGSVPARALEQEEKPQQGGQPQQGELPQQGPEQPNPNPTVPPEVLLKGEDLVDYYFGVSQREEIPSLDLLTSIPPYLPGCDEIAGEEASGGFGAGLNVDPSRDIKFRETAFKGTAAEPTPTPEPGPTPAELPPVGAERVGIGDREENPGDFLVGTSAVQVRKVDNPNEVIGNLVDEETLKVIGRTPDGQFLIVVREDGSQVAIWAPEKWPDGNPVTSEQAQLWHLVEPAAGQPEEEVKPEIPEWLLQKMLVDGLQPYYDQSFDSQRDGRIASYDDTFVVMTGEAVTVGNEVRVKVKAYGPNMNPETDSPLLVVWVPLSGLQGRASSLTTEDLKTSGFNVIEIKPGVPVSPEEWRNWKPPAELGLTPTDIGERPRREAPSLMSLGKFQGTPLESDKSDANGWVREVRVNPDNLNEIVIVLEKVTEALSPGSLLYVYIPDLSSLEIRNRWGPDLTGRLTAGNFQVGDHVLVTVSGIPEEVNRRLQEEWNWIVQSPNLLRIKLW